MRPTHLKPEAEAFDFSDTSDSQGEETLNKYKTEMCRNWEQGFCAFGNSCSFAHGENELRLKPLDDRPCLHYFQHGYCLYGGRCQYSHARLNREDKRAKVYVSIPQFIEFV